MNMFLSRMSIALTAVTLISGGFINIGQAQVNTSEMTNLRGSTPNHNYSSTPLAQSDLGFQDTSMAPSKKTIYIQSSDYPPVSLISYPVSPQDKTNFIKLLDLELQKGHQLALTGNLEEADYRVDVQCAGAAHCTELKVYVLSPKRDMLTGFSIKNIATHFGFKRKPMEDVVSELSAFLNQRVGQLNQGDYGYSHY